MKIRTALTALFRRKKIDAEMSEEMRLHLEQRTRENVAAGMSADEARYAALRKFGGVEQVKEQCRGQRWGVSLELFWRDLRQAARSLGRAPGFSAAVVTTLALCFGPTTAVFSALYGLVLAPMPFPQSEALVQIHNVAEKRDAARHVPLLAQYVAFRERADLFEGFALMDGVNGTIGEESAPARISVTAVSPGFFSLLRVKPRLGRFFTEDEMIAGKDHVFVITESYWETNYAADPDVIGRKVWMDGEPYTIVGVAPRGFTDFQTSMKVFKPFLWRPDNLWNRVALVIGRVRDGVSLDAAEQQLEALNRETMRDAPANVKARVDSLGYRMGVRRWREDRGAPFASSLILIQTAAAFVLLIGCLNVVNLFLARANARRQELAVRHALGAGRAALLQHMLMEGVLLSGGGGLLGLGLGQLMVQLLNRYLPLVVRWVPEVRLQMDIVWAMLAAAVVVGAAVALVPFVWVWRAGIGLQHARTSSAGGSARWMSRTLVVVQVATACVLLLGALLMMRSFANVLAVDPGFDAGRVMQAQTNLPRIRYQNPSANKSVRKRLITAFTEIPGVQSVALASGGIEKSFPMATVRFRSPSANDAVAPQVGVNVVAPEFFRTVGVPLIEGREFTAHDTSSGEGAATIVDETFVSRFCGGRSPVGRELTLSPAGAPDVWMRVVGVARRAELSGLEAREGPPLMYVPLADAPLGFVVLVRTTRAAADVIADMRLKVHSIDPALPVIPRGTFQESLLNLMITRRGIMFLLGGFAALALFLAGVGLYGVLSYDVTQRTREIGIRGALGATRSQIMRMVLHQGAVRIALGLVVGAASSLYLTRFLRGLLFGVGPADPIAFALVTAAAGAVGLLASWLPARRAAKVDPLVALRCE